MKHYGDICQMKGAEIAPVDIVTFGAPCQDLSVAGLRKGMKHEDNGDDETTRSGLFFEAIRIIKEMREHDRASGRTGELIRCRFAVYENVPGAFSSNGGADFAAVLTALVRIVEPDAPEFPIPGKGGWKHADSFYGVGADGQPFSVAWRLHDAQYHGVPQRRKRICVLADFAGLTAPWILFDPKFERVSEDGEPYAPVGDFGNEPEPEVCAQRESVSGDSEPGGAQGEGTAAGAQNGADDTGGDQGTFYI